jgi:hypothetical protein
LQLTYWVYYLDTKSVVRPIMTYRVKQGQRQQWILETAEMKILRKTTNKSLEIEQGVMILENM